MVNKNPLLNHQVRVNKNRKGFCNLIFSGVKHDRNVTKMRVLTFLQSAENQKEVTFETIEKEMQIPSDDIESFIIEGEEERKKNRFLLRRNFIYFSCSNENDTL